MKSSHLGWTAALIVLLMSATLSPAQSLPTGGFGGDTVAQPPPPGGGAGLIGTLPPPLFGGGGMIGMSGCFGGCCNFSGCIGMPCSFGGCIGGTHCSIGGCFGGFPCQFGGCFGGFPAQFGGNFGGTTQTYSQWSHSPGRSYFYRMLHVKTPAPNESTIEFIMVHQPERPKHYYYFDPVDKKYFGRYLIGAKTEQCFALVSMTDRKLNLKDIPESAYRTIASMPTMPQVIRPRPGTTVDPTLQNVKLMRPPEAIPDQLLGLPPEEGSKK